MTKILFTPEAIAMSDAIDVWKIELHNARAQIRSLSDAVAILGKRNSHAMVLLERVAGHELGVHRPNDLTKDEYYTSWDDGEYYIKQALSYLKGEL